MPALLAGSSVFMVRKQDSDFSDIFLGYLTGGILYKTVGNNDNVDHKNKFN